MLHHDRRRAESFGTDPERYDRSRPTYPDSLIDELSPAGKDVLDVGCGTGIAAGLLADRGGRVLGVEIDPRMAELARRKGIPVEVSSFEAWDPAGRTFDLLSAGQAWHWIEPLSGVAKAASLLRPGGRLALFWNVGRIPDDISARIDAIYEAVAPGADSYSYLLGFARGHDNDGQLAAIRSCPSLSEPAVSTFPWSRSYTRDEWLDQLPTHSDHAALPPAVLDRVLSEVGTVIDSFGGAFEMQYRTMLISAVRH